ncbi:MAG: chitobiase/beta-hexosaminidase C-terminal domain-containing protein, partial [Bacteroidales bacterium]|nr:chitobiase/beta-hexosaminidase C-terminal domain-containing protein [Bacteroidales bacterium]
MKKTLLTLIAVLATLLPVTASAAVSTWSFEWNTSKNKGGQGFYNFGASAVEKDFYTTELNGLQWKASAEGTIVFAYTASSGQYIGSADRPPVKATLSTSDLAGLIKAVRVSARVNKDTMAGNVSVTVNGKSYLNGTNTTASLTNSIAEYEFKVADADAQEGEIVITFNQTSDTKGPLYVKKIEIDYETVESSVPAPTFSVAAGTYDEAQSVSLAVSSLEAGKYTIYYTTDGSNPKLEDGTRKAYTEPIAVAETATLKAVTHVGTEYSDVAEAKYVIRKDPQIRFNEAKVSLITGEEGYADLLNPNKVTPIKYSSSAPLVCSVDSKGTLYTSYVKEDSEAVITAKFDGDANYYPASATMTVTVVAKTPLKEPVVTPLGGKFNDAVDVKISTDDENAVTIWYSTTAKSAEEFEESDYTQSTVVEGKEATVTLDKSCTLYVMTRGYNVNSPV